MKKSWRVLGREESLSHPKEGFRGFKSPKISGGAHRRTTAYFYGINHNMLEKVGMDL